VFECINNVICIFLCCSCLCLLCFINLHDSLLLSSYSVYVFTSCTEISCHGIIVDGEAIILSLPNMNISCHLLVHSIFFVIMESCHFQVILEWGSEMKISILTFLIHIPSVVYLKQQCR
jgi:hypothetical protein